MKYNRDFHTWMNNRQIIIINGMGRRVRLFILKPFGVSGKKCLLTISLSFRVLVFSCFGDSTLCLCSCLCSRLRRLSLRGSSLSGSLCVLFSFLSLSSSVSDSTFFTGQPVKRKNFSVRSTQKAWIGLEVS